MAQLPDYDQSQHEAKAGGGSGGVVDPGGYTVAIEKSEYLDVISNPANKKLDLQITILEGPSKGRKIFDTVNLVNLSAEAQRIGRERYNAYKLAVGFQPHEKVLESNDLHNKAFFVEVMIEPAKPYTKNGQNFEGKPKNKVVDIQPLSAAPAPTQAAPVAAAPVVAAAATPLPVAAAAAPSGPQTAAPAAQTAPWRS